MPIACSHLGDGSGTGATSVATGSISPTGNALLLATVNSKTDISAEPNEPTLSGNGLTWVNIDAIYYDTGGTSRRKVSWFRALGASPSAGAVTASFGGQTQSYLQISVEEFTGVDTSGTNGSGAVVQAVSNTDGFVTLAAFSDASNATYGSFGLTMETPASLDVGSGFTATHNDDNGGNLEMLTEYQLANDTSVDFSSSGGVNYGGLGVEVKAAAAANTRRYTLPLIGVG